MLGMGSERMGGASSGMAVPAGMRLYANPTSPFVRVVRMALHEKGLAGAVEVVMVDAWGDAPAFLDANPAGRVPVLLGDGGMRLAEAPLILHYLDDLQPDPPVLPRGAGAAAALAYIFNDPDTHVFIQDEQDGSFNLNVAGKLLGIVEAALLQGGYLPLKPAGIRLANVNFVSVGGSPLFGFDSVVVAPHLGASTVEAQDKAGVAVARSVRLALAGEFVPDAVNVQAGGVVAEELRPALPLVEKLGRVFTALAGGVAATLQIQVCGEISALDVSVLQLAALKGVFAEVVEEQVTFVNAPALAVARGVEVSLVTTPESGDYRNEIRLHGVLAGGATVSVAGTLTGTRQVEKLTAVDGFDVEVVLSDHLLVFRYSDGPGVVGRIGAALGAAGINIAGAQVSRTRQGGDALMALGVDSAVPGELLESIATSIGARAARAVDLT